LVSALAPLVTSPIASAAETTEPPAPATELAPAAAPAPVPPPAPSVAPSPTPVVLPAPPRSFPPAFAPVGFESPTVTVRLGILLQPQYQILGENTYSGQGQNLYVRRARVILGGTLFGVVDYFFDTDYPNLFIGKAASGTPTVKYTPSENIQDAFLTYRPFRQLLMVDAGYFLPPMAHNTMQSAATLYGLDFFEYSFQHDQAFGTQSPITTSVGRDTGVQVRGLLFGDHLEYRVGMFQGLRGAKTTSATGSENSFRFTGRIQINFLQPETGFFYAGTYLGTKRILSIGGSYDFQNSLANDYQYFAGDAFVDLPVGLGVITAQVNVAHWNGHMFIPMVPVAGQTGIVLEDQTAVMSEAGFTFFAARLSPIVRFEHIEGPSLPPQNRYGGGLSFWPLGHNSNLKAFYTRITQAPPPPPAVPYHSANQFQLQWQAFFF
jgi:hypothetical protein